MDKEGIKEMNTGKFITAGASLVAGAMLFTGCAGITHEPKVDVSSLADIDEDDFYKALKAIDIDEDDVAVMSDTFLSFESDDDEFEIIIDLTAESSNGNFYSYTQCADEATAKALFEYYYQDYKYVFDDKDFSGISSHEVGDDTAYVLIDGRLDNDILKEYTPYHDALFLKGDVVIFAMASDYEASIEKEVNVFLDALEYPHP